MSIYWYAAFDMWLHISVSSSFICTMIFGPGIIFNEMCKAPVTLMGYKVSNIYLVSIS